MSDELERLVRIETKVDDLVQIVRPALSEIQDHSKQLVQLHEKHKSLSDHFENHRKDRAKMLLHAVWIVSVIVGVITIADRLWK